MTTPTQDAIALLRAAGFVDDAPVFDASGREIRIFGGRVRMHLPNTEIDCTIAARQTFLFRRWPSGIEPLARLDTRDLDDLRVAIAGLPHAEGLVMNDTQDVQYLTIKCSNEPVNWPKFVFLPWSTTACPMEWEGPTTRGWWVYLAVAAPFGRDQVVSVTGGGEGYSHAAAEQHAEELALAELRRIDMRTLSLPQLAIRALALAALVRRVEGICDADN